LEGVLIVAVMLTTVAVATQALVLVAIYLNSKRIGEQFERFMKETREVMVPVKAITENLRVASGNLVELGISAREQFRRVEDMVSETGEALHTQIDRLDQASRDVVERINETTEIVQSTVIKPFREVSALAKAVSRGLETFLFRRNQRPVDQAHQDEELFI
jgi:hypothetical protein